MCVMIPMLGLAPFLVSIPLLAPHAWPLQVIIFILCFFISSVYLERIVSNVKCYIN